MLMRWLYRIAALAALPLLATALYWTGRLAYADWLFIKGAPASMRQAIRLAPGTSEYYVYLALAEPGRAVEILEEGAALNPRDWLLQFELGMAADRQGDSSKAESRLLEAMRLNAGFSPRAALSDFYFYRRDQDKFWPVTKAALAMSYGDVTRQFRDCWTLSSDPQTILEKAIPARPAVLRKYIEFLLAEGKLEAAGPVAVLLLPLAEKDAVPTLMDYCDHALAEGRADDALAVWNGLARRKLIPYRELAAGQGESPVNGDFRSAGVAGGFDWQTSAPGGIYTELTSNPTGLALNFSGKQPENTEILSQYVPLLPRRRYVLSVRYDSTGIGAESGLTWTLATAASRDLLDGHGLLPGGADGDREQKMPFETPDKAALGRLIFGYRRMRGTTRIEGTLTLRKIALSLAPEGSQ